MRAPLYSHAHLSEYRLPTCHSPGPVDSRDWAWFLWVSQGLAHEGGGKTGLQDNRLGY